MSRKREFDVEKAVPLRSARKLYLVPAHNGKPGYQIAEFVKAGEEGKKEVTIRRWESGAKEFRGSSRVPEAHLIREPDPGDPRLAAIDAWIEAERKRLLEIEEKKQARNKTVATFAAEAE